MNKNSVQNEYELSPHASSLIESLRDMGYSLGAALADVIDNSITAGASNIHLFADTQHSEPAIGILDDGAGMTNDELLEAMRPGTRNPLESRHAKDLGRFGLGLKTASFSQCRCLTVVTRKGSNISCATWDLDKVAELNRWIITIPDNARTVRWFERLQDDGTLVVWEKIDRLFDSGSKNGRNDLVRHLDEASSHIEFVFHRYLSCINGNKLAIFMNGLKLCPFDPFNMNHPATQHHQIETIRLEGGDIKIWPVTLPNHDKVSKDEWEKYAGQEGYLNNQGFYLYRNQRLIIHGTWFRLAQKAELTKLARVGIDIPNSLDFDWKIDVRKASAQLPAPVRDRLSKIIECLLNPSRKTIIRPRTPLSQPSPIPVWIQEKDKNQIFYRIDEKHPEFSVFLESLDSERARQFKRILRLIESTFPLETLQFEINSSSDKVVNKKIANEDLQAITSSVWHFLHNQGKSPEEIKKLMRNAEPFRSQWADTSKFIKSIGMI